MWGNFVKTSERGNFKDSIHSFYYNSGQIEKIENYTIAKIIRTPSRPSDFYEKTFKTDIWKSFYESGRISEIVYYKENEINGEQTQYFDQDENNLKYKATYRNGTKIGEELTYFATGQISTIKNRDTNGYKSGKEIIYAVNGVMLQSTDYFENRKHGKRIVNYENGKPKMRGDFEFNLEKGEWISYYNSGMIFKKIQYSQGGNETICFYNDGIKFAHVVVDSENHTETFVFYDKTGKISTFQELFSRECDNCIITAFSVEMDLDGIDIWFVSYHGRDLNINRSKGETFSFSSKNHK